MAANVQVTRMFNSNPPEIGPIVGKVLDDPLLAEFEKVSVLAKFKAGKGRVACCSVPTFDGYTGERIGWMYGVHIIYRMPVDGKCPECGLVL